ncbi:meiotic recombination protein REC8 homolog isoform X2 [Corythoichthys intestinalis]|uniref:meiotic recombination protein REC8 homolog isoform X2 n=1 Tax=Corythoichthys intestinalis TaxID=161448 RepID=UPI0025A61A0E|nr:meiotic recombination protein REC8 homolog isoform X2 [Corythoichthys intestinalis]
MDGSSNMTMTRSTQPGKPRSGSRQPRNLTDLDEDLCVGVGQDLSCSVCKPGEKLQERLAATRGVPVPRRECLKVNVRQTCEDIISYILEQVPPPQPHLPRPRFSLYLSSQLQYGVVVVYHRQCVIFLQELQSIIGQLLKYRGTSEINMKTSGKKTLVLADEADMLMDPLFGAIDELLPSPGVLPMDKRLDVSPEMPGPSQMSSSSSSSKITASPRKITMREPEPALTLPEFQGEDLTDNVLDIIDILMAQDDNFLGELDRPVAAPGAEQEGERAPEPGTDATLEVDPTSAAGRDVTSLPQDGPTEMLPQEEPTEMAQPPADQVTPSSAPPPSLSISDTEDTTRKRKGRQLIFFDPRTQIPHKELEKQLKDPLLETRVRPLLPPESLRLKTASELLCEPCGVLPEELLFLWRQAATITPVDDTELRQTDVQSSDSDLERENLVVAEQREASIEMPRDVAEPGAPEISGPTSMPLEASGTSESTREVSPLYLSEPDRSRRGTTPQSISEIPEDLEMLEEEGKENVVLFHDLLPPDADRRSVSKNFQKLLEILSTKKLRAEQAEAFGDILILPGINYTEEHEPQ